MRALLALVGLSLILMTPLASGCFPGPGNSGCGTHAAFDQVLCSDGSYCPANSYCTGTGCVCNSGYTAETCSGAACNGGCSAPNYYCAVQTNSCPSNAPLYCSSGWCCPYGNGGSTNVCCNNNPQSSGCTLNGQC